MLFLIGLQSKKKTRDLNKKKKKKKKKRKKEKKEKKRGEDEMFSVRSPGCIYQTFHLGLWSAFKLLFKALECLLASGKGPQPGKAGE